MGKQNYGCDRRKNRGLLATEQDKQAILIAIAQLEDRNPTPRPVEALCDLLDGNWRPLYYEQEFVEH